MILFSCELIVLRSDPEQIPARNIVIYITISLSVEAFLF